MRQGTALLMFNSFASSLWMMPFSKYCRTSNKYCKHFSGEKHAGTHTYRCEEEEFKSNLSGWPTKIINIEIPSTRGFDAYPSFSEIPEANLSGMECGLPTQLSFSAREIADGTFFKAIEDYDPDSKRLLYQLEKSYLGDPVLNPLTPWDRPPIRNVFYIYGTNSKTKVGYYFAPSGKPYPDNWIITDVVSEYEGTLVSRGKGRVYDGFIEKHINFNKSYFYCQDIDYNHIGHCCAISSQPILFYQSSSFFVELAGQGIWLKGTLEL